MGRLKVFTNGRVCIHGGLKNVAVYVDTETGLIIKDPGLPEGHPSSRYSVQDWVRMMPVDLKNRILAPAFIELQTNGCLGVHFTQYTDGAAYQKNIEKVSKYLVESGVASFYVTLPTVEPVVFKKILPQLEPRAYCGGAALLGAHCEGPWLNPSRKGAHDASLMRLPRLNSIEKTYGDDRSTSAIKLITIAPELEGSTEKITALTEKGIIVSLGHSAADFDTGSAALQAGAKSLTHVFNAMNPLHHRTPGLAGLIASKESPYFSLIADGIHLHPATLAMAYRANPPKCILITDSVEMAGLPDGLYPGHAQIPHQQRKQGSKVTIEGTDTLIGSCSSIDECVRNLMQWSGCSLAQAVRCATENIANLMELGDRGTIDEGRQADFVVLDDMGRVLETYIAGKQVYERR